MIRARARAAVQKGPLGQPWRSETGFLQQGDGCRRHAARWRVRGSDAQGRRDGARRRSDRNAALHGTRAAAVSRAYRQVPSAADRGHAHGRDPRTVDPRRLSSDQHGHLGACPSEITPGEAETIAGVVDTFVPAIETTKKVGSRFNLMQILTAGNYDEDNSEDSSDGDDYEKTGHYEETDDCAS